MNKRRIRHDRLIGTGLVLLLTAVTSAQTADLAGYFGFEPLEIVKIGRRAGPIVAADMNGDGLMDLIAVNNQASRLEVHYQRRHAVPDDVWTQPVRVNEFPDHWRYRRESVPVTHRISAVAPIDFDGDGRLDLVYAGFPAEIVFLGQKTPGVFEVVRRHRVKDLAATRDGLHVADVRGDARAELLALVDGAIVIWPLEGTDLGPKVRLATNAKMVAILVEDFDGDGRTDVAGVIPDDPAPVRVWFRENEAAEGGLGSQVRFEMPPLVEASTVRVNGEPAARLAVIERSAKRIVVYQVTTEEVAQSGDREAALRIRSFTDPGNRKRAHAVIDLDGDGDVDLVATDTEANALVAYRQGPAGFGPSESWPSLSDLSALAAGNVDDDPAAELFVLSEKEGVVGRCDPSGGEIPFPTPLPIPSGHTPTALNLVALEDGPRVAIVAKDARDYVLELLALDGTLETIDLGKLSRSPDTIVALDADQDGRTDLLLFTRDKPMMMLRAAGDGFKLAESKDMGQYGLVKAAKSENTATFDIDGDGHAELLVADQNFIRALRYEPDPVPGVSPGWQVVTQVNARDSTSKLVSIAVLQDRIVAADQENDRLVVMSRDQDGVWREHESLSVRGFPFTEIHAGSFSGNGTEDLLAVGEDGFAVVRLTGDRIALREVGSWRSPIETHAEHELVAGDLNGDGFSDLVALDAGEQMAEIFTFTETGRMLYATAFKTFESMLFSGGESREYEPSQALIVDVTGDGASDLVLLAHDRLLIYPQMVQAD